MRAKVAAVAVVLAGILLGAAGAAGPPTLEPPLIQTGPGSDGSLPGWTQQTGGTFTFLSQDPDPNVGFRCRLDGGAWVGCASPYDLPTPPAPLADGAHDFTVQAIIGDPSDPTDRSKKNAVWQWTVDTTPPTLPADRTPEATSAAGAVVSFVAKDAQDPQPQLACSPASGHVFPLGHTEVSCTATDHAGNVAQGTFDVNVVDTTGPVIGAHGGVSAEQTSLAGGVAEYDLPHATDLVDPAPAISCSPESGSFFPPGDTTVTCTASDSFGNQSHSTFKVTISDTTPPVLASHSDVAAEQASASGTVVAYDLPSATDAVDPAPFVSCVPPPGSLFPKGNSTVTCTATDSSGNKGTSTFGVRVGDATPPVLAPHPDVLATQTTAKGAVVQFAYAAGSVIDAADPNPTVTCSPESGSLFLFGPPTPVTCTAKDESGNVSEPDTFDVVVQTGEIPPKPTIASSVHSPTNRTGVEFTFSADPSSTLHCRLEGPGQSGAFEECESSTGQSYSNLTDGSYLFTLRVTSSIENVNQSTRAWKVDTAPPAPVGAFRTRSANGRVNLRWTKPVDLGFDHVLIRRKRAGGSSWKKIGVRRDVASMTDWTPSNEVLYVYAIRSFDKAGNGSPASTQRARPSKILSPQFDAIVGSRPLIDWAASLHASYYNLQLWRNGKKVRSVWPVKSSYRPRSRLASGTYRVYVWPGFRAKSAANYGSLLGWSQFTVN